jgi:hypothetical protein
MGRVGALIVLSLLANAGYRARMPAPVDLTSAAPEDLADALAFALRYSGRKRTHDAGEMMAAIVGQAPGGAPRAFRLRHHEETADRRRRVASPSASLRLALRIRTTSTFEVVASQARVHAERGRLAITGRKKPPIVWRIRGQNGTLNFI